MPQEGVVSHLEMLAFALAACRGTSGNLSTSAACTRMGFAQGSKSVGETQHESARRRSSTKRTDSWEAGRSGARLGSFHKTCLLKTK